MRLFFRVLSGFFAYFVWPSFAALWAFGETELIFRERRIALPFEVFGATAAVAVFCFALTASILIVGLWKKRRVKAHEPQTSALSDDGGVEPGGSGIRG